MSMKIIIKETSAVETLSLIDPKSGVDYIYDFIGRTGALNDGQFEWDADHDAYVCDQETFDWWRDVVEANQVLEYRIDALAKEHGLEKVYEVINELDSVDLEDHAAHINRALDEVFGFTNC